MLLSIIVYNYIWPNHKQVFNLFIISVENIDLANMNVDFYTGNLHKWAYSCKGTAFMWVNPLHQGYIHPLNTSHTYKMPFPDEFYSRGTNDSQTKYIAASNALQFYDR